MKTKVMAPELVLLQQYPELNGNVGDGGWVALHNTSFNGQRTSICAMSYLHSLGFNFDIQTNDGKLLEDVTINDAHIKMEYNVMPSIESYPANGIHCWRLSSHRGPFPPVPVSEIVDYKTGPKSAEKTLDEVYGAPSTFLSEELKAQLLSGGRLTAKDFQQVFEPVEGVGPHYANDKYKREIKPGVFVDVYDVIDCYQVHSGALQHALKKILATGNRGHKSYEEDLIDILSSVERALFQHQEKMKI